MVSLKGLASQFWEGHRPMDAAENAASAQMQELGLEPYMPDAAQQAAQYQDAAQQAAQYRNPYAPAPPPSGTYAAKVEIPAKPSRIPLEVADTTALEEYASVASAIGLASPGMTVELFKAFMAEHDLPVYNYAEVVKYMDAKAANEGKGYGWQWSALRQQDTAFSPGRGWGTPSSAEVWRPSVSRHYVAADYEPRVTPASDYYTPHGAVYDKVVPLHALKKVALVEREFKGGKMAFAVCDYATQPYIRPDPFLLAFVPALAHQQEARFVIDVWDEPGFGIESMVK